MSNVAQGAAIPEVSRWVVPDVSDGSAANALVSEQAIANLREEARVSGYAEGLQAGRKEGETQARARLNLLDKMIQHVAAPLDQLEPEALAAMVELSVKVSRTLINRELSLDNSLVLEAVSRALAVAPSADTPLRISVNPSDLAVVQGAYTDFDLQQNPVLVGDAAVEVGGAIVESGLSLVDAQIDNRLAAVLAELLDPVEPE